MQMEEGNEPERLHQSMAVSRARLIRETLLIHQRTRSLVQVVMSLWASPLTASTRLVQGRKNQCMKQLLCALSSESSVLRLVFCCMTQIRRPVVSDPTSTIETVSSGRRRTEVISRALAEAIQRPDREELPSAVVVAG